MKYKGCDGCDGCVMDVMDVDVDSRYIPVQKHLVYPLPTCH